MHRFSPKKWSADDIISWSITVFAATQVIPALMTSPAARVIGLSTFAYAAFRGLTAQGVDGTDLRARHFLVVAMIAYTFASAVLLRGESATPQIQLAGGMGAAFLFGLIRTRPQARRVMSRNISIIISLACAYSVIAMQGMGALSARIASRSSEESTLVLNAGVGGYSLAYAAVVNFPVLLSRALGSNSTGAAPRPIGQFAWAMGAAANAVFVVKSQYFIAIILLVLSATLVVCPRLLAIVRTVKISVVLIGISSIVLIWALGAEVYSQREDGTTLASKVTALEGLALRGDAQGAEDDRLRRYRKSLDAAMDSTWLGAQDSRFIGGHSTILDALAMHGVFFGAGILFILLYPVAWSVRHQRSGRAFAMALVLVGVGTLLLNVITIPIAIALYLGNGSIEIWSGSVAMARDRQEVVQSGSRS